MFSFRNFNSFHRLLAFDSAIVKSSVLANRASQENVFGKRAYRISAKWSSSENESNDYKPSAAGRYRDPLSVLKYEFRCYKEGKDPASGLEVPRETDILVIGGGAVGMSVAYWLKQRNVRGYTVTVIEKDFGYKHSSTTASVGGIRQQFSCKENIQMSLFGSEFLRNLPDYLGVPDHEPPDVQFCPQGYLFLVNEERKSNLLKNNEKQKKCGARVELLNQSQLKDKYEWLNTDGIAMGSLGLQNEGHFDPWLLLAAFRAKCEELDVKFVKGEVSGFSYTNVPTLQSDDMKIKSKKEIEHTLVSVNGVEHPIKSAYIVNCAGPLAGHVSYLAGIGRFPDELSVPVPIEPRKRYVYVLHCPKGPGLDMPMFIDPSGFYVRREGLGNYYICGMSPKTNAEPDVNNLDVDDEFFHEEIWPRLADRIPAFNELKVTSAWAGYYDYNYFDENLIIGNHPYFKRFFIASGSSGHGIQHSPAIGRAIMELIIDDEFVTIDLSSFSLDRVIYNESTREENIV